MKSPRRPIVVADDIRTNLLFIGSCLEEAGHNHIVTCQDSSALMDCLDRNPAEILLLDLRMPDPDGITLLPKIRQAFPDVPVIIVTDVSDVKTAVACMRDGAFDFITKPVDRDLFRITVDRALSFRNLARENRELKNPVLTKGDLKHPQAFASILTHDPDMVRIFHYIEAVAESPEPVLITGETGVGKELVSRVIHHLSGRTGKLVAVNVAGLDDTVFSDTLFGHVAGAFTGADKARNGLVETAARGTLFLDEIGDLSGPSQVKLLRLLQERDYLPLGMDTPRQSTARIIVATNEDLWTRHAEGRFRKDLIYRLNTHHIHLPPLSRRRGDIPLLLDYFIDEACERLNAARPSVSPAVLTRLDTYPFPGNVRELQAMAFDAVSRSGGSRLEVRHFSRYLDGSGPARGATRPDRLHFPEVLPTIREATDLLVIEAMKRSGGRQTPAAAMLGISQPALNKRLKNMNWKS